MIPHATSTRQAAMQDPFVDLFAFPTHDPYSVLCW